MAPMSTAREPVMWITGASSGIGRALALLAAPGYRLILSGRDGKRLAEVAQATGQIVAARAPGATRAAESRTARGMGETIRVLPFDLADPEAVERAGAAAGELHGGIDVLVLCGGVSQRALFAEVSLETMDRLLQVDYRSAVSLVKRCLPLMQRQGSGRIVAVTSLAAKIGAPLRTGYCAAKHALQGFCDALRPEVAGQGIAVTVVVPGFVRTEISRHALTGGGRPHGRMDPLQERGISPEACARDILRAIRHGKAEVKSGFGLKGWLALFLSRLSVGVYSRLIAGSKEL
jgi:short-subunit dehydrogenase